MIKFAKHLLSFYNGECINKRTIINIRPHTYTHESTHTHIYILILYIYININYHISKTNTHCL